MKRVPVIATLVVVLAAIAMVALGIWQLQRRDAKAALLASYARNAELTPIALKGATIAETDLFRRATATCSAPGTPVRAAGRSVDGVSGYRLIVPCREGFRVEMGVTADPATLPVWRGGPVAGLLTYAPDGTPIIARLFGRSSPPVAMLVATRPPVAGLRPSRAPDPSGVPNNHLAYAVQWFAFAAIALAIYALAVRRRMRG